MGRKYSFERRFTAPSGVQYYVWTSNGDRLQPDQSRWPETVTIPVGLFWSNCKLKFKTATRRNEKITAVLSWE